MELKFRKPTKEDIENRNDYDWNVTIGEDDKPLRVCRLEGCYHTIGGRYGNNCLYSYPRNEKPTLDNIREFNGDVLWSYSVEKFNYYGKYAIEYGTRANIYFAGEKIYELRCSWDLMPHKIMTIITELQEHPIPIVEIGYEEKEVIGRKVFFKDKPGIITRYIKNQGCVIIEPDGKVDKFGKPIWESDEEYEYNFEGDVKVDILSSHIWWFRE